MPKEFTYIEETRKRNLLGLHPISTTFLIAPTIVKKLQKSKGLEQKGAENTNEEAVLVEQSELIDKVEDSEDAEAERPTSGIQKETLIDIDNDTEAV